MVRLGGDRSSVPIIELPTSVVAMAWMIFKPDAPLRRATSIVLALYVGAILGQVLCVLPAADMESPMGAGLDGIAAHASSSMGAHASSPTAVHTSSSRATHSPSQDGDHRGEHHGEHPGTRGPSHSGACAVVACASAITATAEHGLGPTARVFVAHVAYLGGMMPPDAEMVPPPPRLG